MESKNKNWFEKFTIKNSTKKNAGKGVFTRVNIKKNEHIGYYTGKILNAKQIERKPYSDSLFILQVTKDYYILGEGKDSSFTSYINHSDKPNARLVVSTRWKTARIVALKNIKKGEEIFYDYSNEYWDNLGKKPK